MWWIIAVLYVLIGICSYCFIFNKWEKKTLFEKIWFSVFWPAVLLAWVFHKLYNWLKK